MLPASAGVPTSRASEPWRTYSELLFSGALEPALTQEWLAWSQTQQGSGVRGSRLKLGFIAGAGNDIENGDQFETFTAHGYGFGLLAADLVQPFLLAYFTLSAHAYSRGSWIAPESTAIDREKTSLSFCAPAGTVAPLYHKWMLVFEEPRLRVLWLNKACPRSWLTEGQEINYRAVPTRYGRISLKTVSAIDSARQVHLSLTDWAPVDKQGSPVLPGGLPEGGLRIRLRAPDRHMAARLQIKAVDLCGGVTLCVKWTGFDSADETLVFTKDDLMAQKGALLGLLRNATVTFG